MLALFTDEGILKNRELEGLWDWTMEDKGKLKLRRREKEDIGIEGINRFWA